MFRSSALGVWLVLMGCSSGTEPISNQQLTSAVKAARFADDSLFFDTYTAWGLPDLALNLSSCRYDAGLGGFDCAKAERANTPCGAAVPCEWSKHVQLFVYDDAGQSLSTYSAAATRLRVVSEVTALLREGAGTGSSADNMRRHSDLTVDGVASAVRLLNGSFTQVDSFVPVGLDGSHDAYTTK